MNTEEQPIEQDDVVVIEERDKHTLLYIAIAAILGVAIGGLAGSIATKGKWESAYQSLESKIEQIENEQNQAVEEKIIQVENKKASLQEEIELQVAQELDNLTAEYQSKLEQTTTLVTELEKINIGLEERVKEQDKLIESNIKELSALTRQTDMQSAILERSRELFQREFKIKQDLDELQDERVTLAPKLERYKKECDVYLEGKSWDASAQACDKHDEINSNISQIDQMIEVHKLDLREIQRIADQLGI